MRALLDTHAFLWWVLDDPRLSSTCRTFVGDGSNDVLLSAAVAMELSVKAGNGRLDLPEPIEKFVPNRLAAEGFQGLAIELRHALRAGILPWIHRDPFDRLLVAQAQVESLPILTIDPVIAQYEVETIW